MANVCGTVFWNSSASWQTDHPTVSECFKNLILVIASCAVLWVVAPFEFIKLCKARINPSPWTGSSICKLTLKVILLLICTLDLAVAVYSYENHSGLDEILASVSYFLTIVLTMILTLMCKNRGIRVSLALPSFWMISTITTLISIYSDIQYFDSNDWTKIVHLVDDTTTFVISVVQLILSSFADKGTVSRGREAKDSCPVEGSALPSRLTFSWMISLLQKSSENSLHQDHLLPLCSNLRSETVNRQFEEIYHARSRNEFQAEYVESKERREKSLLLTLLKIAFKSLAIASFLEIAYTLLYFLPVCILSLILNKETREWHNYVYSVALFIVLLLSSFANSQRKYFGLTGALKMKTAVMSTVFSKALKVSPDTQNIKVLLTRDAENVFQGMCILSEVWGSPIRILLGIYILWYFLGPSCFVGILAAFLLIPINRIVDNCVSYFQKKADLKKNEKISLLTECLHGMKALKLYAWEEIFLEKLMKLRRMEIDQLRKAAFLKMIFKFFYLSATSITTLTTVSAYVLMESTINMEKIVLCFFTIYLLKTPFQNLLHLLAYFVEGITSLTRIKKFLDSKEFENIVSSGSSEENSVEMINASFSWNEKTAPCLKNLNFIIPKGSLVAVVGETGKSTLLKALLGDIHKVDGKVSIKGHMAFVGEKAWIQNTTVEKNILFLREKDIEFYKRVLEACALNTDIESLPAGEETEIGQKGLHLSLSQSLKVDLARAVYQGADLYIFDNIVKYLDSICAEHIFHRVIGRSGILKEKTRIYMTDSEEFLPIVDYILFMKDGYIIEEGTYSQLKEKNGYFTEYFKSCTFPSAKNYKVTERQIIKCDSFGKQRDLWCSAAVTPIKFDVENTISNETVISSKEDNLNNYFKMMGYTFVAGITVIAALACFCEVASGVWLSEWADGREHNPKYNLLIFTLIILSQILLTAICGVSLFASSTMAASKLHTWLLQQIMRASQMIFDTTPVQKIIQSFNVDFHYIDARIPETVYVWLLAVLKVPSLLVIIFIACPYLAVGLIPLVYLFIVIQKLYLTAWQQLQHLTAATSCPLSNLLEDTLSGISHIRLSGASYNFFNRFHSKLDTHNNCFFLFHVVSRWLGCILEIATGCLVLATTIGAFKEGNISDNLIALSIIYTIQLGETLTAMAYIYTLFNNDLKPFERIMSFSQIKQELEWEDPANQPPDSWPDSGSIFVHNLGTGEGICPVIHNINLFIEPGEKIAVIGKEESGIYTFMYSLFRLIEPLEGSIIIDEIDISKLGLRDLRSKLAIIPQETIVFKGTVRQNLDPGQLYTDDSLLSSLKAVKWNTRNSTLNLDTIIDEQISLEEKYVLSIARCILKKPKIVIIDEQETRDSRSLFQESTVLSFCEQPLVDYNGRTIRFMSGEIVSEDFSITPSF